MQMVVEEKENFIMIYLRIMKQLSSLLIHNQKIVHKIYTILPILKLPFIYLRLNQSKKN